MKKYILILLATSLLLSACSIDWNDEKDKKIGELEKQIQDDTFKKKMDCASIKIDTDIKQNWGNMAKKYVIDEIFFSDKKQACIGVITLFPDNGNLDGAESWLYDILNKNWFLSVLYNQPYASCVYPSDVALQNICSHRHKEFTNRIKELKGE